MFLHDVFTCVHFKAGSHGAIHSEPQIHEGEPRLLLKVTPGTRDEIDSIDITEKSTSIPGTVASSSLIPTHISTEVI